MNTSHIYKTVTVIFLTLVVLLIGYGAYVYSQGSIDTSKVKTEASFTSEELLKVVAIDKGKELEQYIEKGIEVKGVIKEITYRDGIYTLILRGVQHDAFIICEMQLEEAAKVQKLKVEELVVVKGIYKGVLIDVILLNCLVI